MDMELSTLECTSMIDLAVEASTLVTENALQEGTYNLFLRTSTSWFNATLREMCNLSMCNLSFSVMLVSSIECMVYTSIHFSVVAPICLTHLPALQK